MPALLLIVRRAGSVMGMKLSLSTLACPSWTLEQTVAAAAECGIGGIDFRGIGPEIDVTRLPAFNEHLPETLELLRKNGLVMPCLCTSVTLVTPAPERWEMMLAECQRYAALAERTGTTMLRIFGGAVPKGMTRDEARVLAQRHLRQLVKITRGHGVRPVLETHDDWATSQRTLEILHEFDPADVGVVWDVEHPVRKGPEAPGDTAQRLGKYLAHTHIKDGLYVDGKYMPKLLGEGDLPLKEFIAALRQVNYPGWVCLETEKRWHSHAPDPEQSVPQFAEWMGANAE